MMNSESPITNHQSPILFMLAFIIGTLAACTPAETPATPYTPTPPPVAPASAVENDTHTTIAWTDGDQPGRTISLFFDSDDSGFDGTLIVADIPAADPHNQFEWHTAAVPNGDYWVYATVDDGTQLQKAYIAGPIAIRHSAACFAPDGKENLLPNGSFEAGILAPTGWSVKKPAFTRERIWEFGWENDSATAHSGNRAVRIANVLNGINSDSAWKDRVIVESEKLDLPAPGENLLLTAWLRTENVAAGHVLFRLKYFDGNGKQLTASGLDTDTFYAGDGVSGKWRRVALLIAPPHQAEKITVSVSLDNSPGTLWVDDMALIPLSAADVARLDPADRFAAPPIAVATAPPEIPPAPADWGATVAQDSSGAWWLVGADGTPFWGTGISYGANQVLLDAVEMDAETYRRTTQVMARNALSVNMDWRADENSPAENYVEWLNFSTESDISAPESEWVMKDRDGNSQGDYPHNFPDVFSPIWQENARNEAEKLLANDGAALKNPRVLGYWTDNEFAFGDLYDFLWGDTAQLAFVDWLQGKNDLPSVDAVFAAAGSNINLDIPAGFEHPAPYASIENLNRAWSSPAHKYRYKTFDDILGNDKPYLRGHGDPVRADLFAFERVVYKIYVDTIVDNIRRVEDDFIARTGQGMHHLIFSNRFDPSRPAALDDLRRNMDIFSRFDVIALNWYPDFNRSRTFHSRTWMEMVKETFHDTTGRPVFISEFGLAAEDSSVPVSRWRAKTVSSQYRRGWGYKNLMATWANLPWVVGANWYQWANQYGGNGNDPRNSGVVDDAGNFYTPLTDVIRSVNEQLQSVARSGSFSLDEIDWHTAEIDVCE